MLNNMGNNLEASREYYDSYFSEQSDLSHDNRERYRRVYSLIDKLNLPQQARVLNVGAGSGRISAHCSKHFEDITAVDITISDSLREVEVVDLCEGALPSLPFRSHKFDLVVCSEVLEHIPRLDQAASVAELARLVSPSGYLVLSTPNPRSFFELCNSSRDGQLIENWIPPNILRDYLEEAGLDIIELRGSFYMLPQLMPLELLLPYNITFRLSDYLGDRSIFDTRELYQYYICKSR